MTTGSSSWQLQDCIDQCSPSPCHSAERPECLRPLAHPVSSPVTLLVAGSLPLGLVSPPANQPLTITLVEVMYIPCMLTISTLRLLIPWPSQIPQWDKNKCPHTQQTGI